MKKEEFEKIVKKAFLSLPENIRDILDNVEICIEEKPSLDLIKNKGSRSQDLLLGLYQGVPKTKWGRGFGQILPDKITLFQEPIEKITSSKREIQEVVRLVLWHEIAHHFGFDEKKIKKLEEKWKKN